MSQQTAETAAAMSVKAAPPVTVGGALALGIPVADWIQYFTLIYLVLMIGHKAWHIIKEWKSGREAAE